jgi:hypothetical protein
MAEDIKKNMKRLAEDTEVKVARGILRWKYRREGRPVPTDPQLEKDSTRVARQAHNVIARRGRNAWNELKRVYLHHSNNKKDEKE